MMLAPEECAVILERYQVLRSIGAGGMGAVYLAKDPRYRDFLVALKVLYPGIVRTEQARERFRTEILASYRVHHRNIVRPYEYFDEENIQAYVMEYVEGQDLLDHLKEGRKPLKEVCSILLQVASALNAIHAQGILHRDLKPENILLTKRGLVKITDFGVARLREARDTITQVGAMVGTPKYFAPEYIELGECDQRADIYAFGVIAYEMIAGRSPFRGMSGVDMMVERFQSTIPPLREEAPECPLDLSNIVSKAMALSVTKRYQKASELYRDLELFAKGKAIVCARGFEREIDSKPAPIKKEQQQPLVLSGGERAAKSVEKNRRSSKMLRLVLMILLAIFLLLVGGLFVAPLLNKSPVSFVDLPNGRYLGLVEGLADAHTRQEIILWRAEHEIKVSYDRSLCQWTGTGYELLCVGRLIKLELELVEHAVAAGRITDLDRRVRGTWSAIRQEE